MNAHVNNPYPHGTPEHHLWAHWHRAFFDQPIHGQLLTIESQLRQNLTLLRHLSSKIASAEVQRELQSCLLEVEENVNLLDEAAEHAFVRFVSDEPGAISERQQR